MIGLATDYRRIPMLPPQQIATLLEQGGRVVALPCESARERQVLAMALADLAVVRDRILPVERTFDGVRRLISAPVVFDEEGSIEWRMMVVAYLSTEATWDSSPGMLGAMVTMHYVSSWDGSPLLKSITVLEVGDDEEVEDADSTESSSAPEDQCKTFDELSGHPLPSWVDRVKAVADTELWLEQNDLDAVLYREWNNYYAGQLTVFELGMIERPEVLNEADLRKVPVEQLSRYNVLITRVLVDVSGLQLPSLSDRYGRLGWDASVRELFVSESRSLTRAVVQFQLYADRPSMEYPPNVSMRGNALYYRFGSEPWECKGMLVEPVVEGEVQQKAFLAPRREASAGVQSE